MNKDKYIYFIQSGKNRPIKIGITINIIERYLVLQTSNPDKLELLGLIKGSLAEETKLHIKFKYINIKGEWYWPTQDLLNYIENLPQKLTQDFNKMVKGLCKCGNKVSHMKIENEIFIGYCRACLMIKDGRMQKFIELNRNQIRQEPKSCKICNRNENYLRRGRCTACNEYFRRNKVDRPEDLINKTKRCINCNILQANLTRNLCNSCYYYQNRYNLPKPVDNLNETKKQP